MPRGFPHGNSFRKFGRPHARLALLRILVNSLIRHERIETTFAKAYETQKYMNRLVEIAKRGMDNAYTNDMVQFWTDKDDMRSKLLNDLVPRYKDHKGDCTRLAIISKPYQMPSFTKDQRYAVLELKGNPLPPLPMEEKNPHTLQNVLIAAAREEMAIEKKTVFKDDK